MVVVLVLINEVSHEIQLKKERLFCTILQKDQLDFCLTGFTSVRAGSGSELLGLKAWARLEIKPQVSDLSGLLVKLFFSRVSHLLLAKTQVSISSRKSYSVHLFESFCISGRTGKRWP